MNLDDKNAAKNMFLMIWWAIIARKLNIIELYRVYKKKGNRTSARYYT